MADTPTPEFASFADAPVAGENNAAPINPTLFDGGNGNANVGVTPPATPEKLPDLPSFPGIEPPNQTPVVEKKEEPKTFLGGKFKDESEALSKISEWESKIAEAGKKEAEYQAKLQEYEGTIRPNDKIVADLNDFIRGATGAEAAKRVEQFFKYQQLDVNEIDDRAALIHKTLFENPDLTERQAELLVLQEYEKKYGAGDVSKLDPEAEDYAEQKAAIEEANELTLAAYSRDGKKAREVIRDFQTKIAIPPAEQRQMEAERNEQEELETFNKSIEATLPKVGEGFRLDIGMRDVSGAEVNVPFEFRFDPATVKSAIENLSGGRLGISLPDGGIDYDKMVQKELIYRNFSKIVAHAIAEGQARGAKSVVNRVENASPGRQGQFSTPNPDVMKEFADKLSQAGAF